MTSSGYGRTGAGSVYGGGGGGGGSSAASPLDVDRRAEEDLQTMSNDRRQIVDALTEERTV